MQRVRTISSALPLLVVGLLVVSFQMPVQAHNPSGMNLSYDIDTDTLLVEVTHGPVSGDHRIAQIQIWKNDVLVNTRNYDPPQETTSGMDDVFNIDANAGDVLKATATCSVSGSITEQITVGVDSTDTTTIETTPTDTTTPQPTEIPTTFLILAGIIIIGVIVILVGVLKRR